MHAFLPVPLHSSEKKTWEEAQYEEENLIPTQTLMNKKCLLWLPIIQSPSDLRQEIWGELVLAHCNFDLILRLNWWHRLQLRIRIDVNKWAAQRYVPALPHPTMSILFCLGMYMLMSGANPAYRWYQSNVPASWLYLLSQYVSSPYACGWSFPLVILDYNQAKSLPCSLLRKLETQIERVIQILVRDPPPPPRLKTSKCNACSTTLQAFN